MLYDRKAFASIEQELRKNGKLTAFDDECGPVIGRMMITLTDLPEGIIPEPGRENSLYAFLGSFDFYDTMLGIALYTDKLEPAENIWVVNSSEENDIPAEEWIEFFISTLAGAINDDGSFGIPIYTFVNDTSDMTIVPARDEI